VDDKFQMIMTDAAVSLNE